MVSHAQFQQLVSQVVALAGGGSRGGHPVPESGPDYAVFPNGLASRFHQLVFQPLTERAAVDGRQYAFVYESDSQTVQVRGARVYRADGQIDETVETGEGSANDQALAMYTSARTFYVRFPRLDPGDVVELQYRVEDVAPTNAFADYFGEVTSMQASEPLARACGRQPGFAELNSPLSRSYDARNAATSGFASAIGAIAKTAITATRNRRPRMNFNTAGTVNNDERTATFSVP